jgi:predicted CXXCH cytochrome family protein
MGCHQGPAVPQADLGASKLSTWAGTGSSHVDGPFLERARTFARLVDKGRGRSPVLKAQCGACHDVHAKDHATSLSPMAFDPQGKALKARPTLSAQVCYGCHAGPEAARLSRNDPDLGALMRQGVASSHAPGATAASRTDLPSLRTSLFTGALDCTSCHDNPNPAGPRGPHSSPYPKLLKANYGREGDIATAGNRGDDLCFSCHDRGSILGNQSFPFHFQHLMGFTGIAPVKGGQSRMPPWLANGARPVARTSPLGTAPLAAGVGQPTPCATCHDPHGSAKNAALIAFDKAVVTRASVGVVEYQRTGLGHGNCTLSCHGYDHVQTRY